MAIVALAQFRHISPLEVFFPVESQCQGADMSAFISRVLLTVFPFFAALFFAFVFVRILGHDFVQFSNWYLTIIVGLQAVIFLGVIAVGLQAGRLDSIFIGIVLFFSMSLLVLAGMSIFQLWFSIPLTPKAFSVVANYQHEVTRLTGEGIKLGYDPQFQSGLQKEFTIAAVLGTMNLLLKMFLPSMGGQSANS